VNSLYRVGKGSLVLLILLVFLGDWLAPYGFDEYARPGVSYSEEGECTISSPPFPPGGGHVLGTDAHGRDILTWLLRGAKYTIGMVLVATLVRLLLAIPLGAVAGWAGGRVLTGIEAVSGTLAGIPMILAAMLLLKGLQPMVTASLQNMLILASVIALTDSPRLVLSYAQTVRRVKIEPFVEAARASGGRSWWILRRHILPHLMSGLAATVPLEMARVLTVMAQLSVFSVFLGGGVVWEDLTGGRIVIAAYPEWGSLIGGARNTAFSRPWIVGFPLLAYGWTIVSLNLVGEGMRRRFMARGTGLFHGR